MNIEQDFLRCSKMLVHEIPGKNRFPSSSHQLAFGEVGTSSGALDQEPGHMAIHDFNQQRGRLRTRARRIRIAGRGGLTGARIKNIEEKKILCIVASIKVVHKIDSMPVYREVIDY